MQESSQVAVARPTGSILWELPKDLGARSLG